MITMTVKLMMPVMEHPVSVSPIPLEYIPLQPATHRVHQFFKCSLILSQKSTFMNIPFTDPSLSLCNKTEWLLLSCQVGEEVGSSRATLGVPGFLLVHSACCGKRPQVGSPQGRASATDTLMSSLVVSS